MPTYEYVCTACGSPLEVVQSIHDPSLTECPTCGGALRKVFGNVGVVFKGSGFYRTDNRSKTKGAASSPSTGSSGPAKGTETPAAAKTPATSSSSAPASTPTTSSAPAAGSAG